ncbi:MAG TPA: hypothetical protein VF766_00435, partial [Pyrinomonadaceae bacterium]
MMPAPRNAPRATKRKVPTPPAIRSVDEQRAYLDGSFAALRKAFNADPPRLTDDPVLFRPEEVIVVRYRGEIGMLDKTLRNKLNLDVLSEYAEVDDSDDADHADEGDEDDIEEANDSAETRVFITSVNQYALDRLMTLWRLHRSGKPLYGMAPLRNLFKYIDEIRYWNSDDRLSQNDVKAYLRDALASDVEEVDLEVELWFRDIYIRRDKVEKHCHLLLE